MNRLAVACLTAVLACSAPTLHAQISARAYAPENLRTLSISDQQRVISQEYAEQSGGRRIPDDQMRFYLDQVNRSSWGFSRIKQDIATSLSGSGGGWNPGGGGGWNPGSGNGVVRCESRDSRQRVCDTGWRSARLSRQLSDTRCEEGRNWGSRNRQVWVSGGCRAEFVEGRGGGWNPGGPGNNYTVTCSSNDNRQQTCAWDSRQGRPALVQQLSGSACVEGRTWGYRGNALWVSNGCRARFGTR
jgi:hypothetical protein